MKDDKIIVGAIYNALSKEMFAACKSKEAFLNGKKIRVSRNFEWINCLPATGFYYDRGNPMIENLDFIKKFFLLNVLGIG